MTLLEFAKELNDFVLNNPVDSQFDVNLSETEIVLENGRVLGWDDDEDLDYEEDYDCEIGFNPYLGCYDFDC